MDRVKKNPIYLLAGEENFIKDEFINDIKNKFLEKSNKELNFTSFSAKDSKIEEILAVARTSPFLGKKRVIIIKDIDKLDEKGKESIVSFAKNPTLTTCLVLETSKSFLGDEFLRSISELATFIKAQSPKYGALDRWVRERTSFFNKRITKDATELLKELAGNNLELLSREIEKIVSFIDKKDLIEARDVEKIVGKSVKEDIFILSDYINKKDANGALLVCKRLLEQGRKVHEIIGLIGGHFRRILLTKVALGDAKKRKTYLNRIETKPFYRDRLISQSDNFKIDELKEKLKFIFIADRSIKTGYSKPELALDILISRLCVT